MTQCSNGHENPDGQAFCGSCGQAISRVDSSLPPPLEVHERGARASRRGRTYVAATTLLFIAILGSVALGKLSSSNGPTPSQSRQTPATDLDATVTTAASTLPPTSMMASTTTTTSLELAMSASLSVAVERVFTHEYDYDKSLDLALRIKNTSPRAIAAFQTSILVEVTDTLGRDFTRNLLFDCTEAPLAAGEARQAGAVDGDDLATLERRVKATDNCTLGGWDVNQFIRNDVGMYEALLGGNLPRTTVTLNRIVFADGTSLGTAVTGR